MYNPLYALLLRTDFCTVSSVVQGSEYLTFVKPRTVE
jgi:hypothetical protein